MLHKLLFGLLAYVLISDHFVLAQQNTSSESNYELRLDISGFSIFDEDGISINCTRCFINGDLSLASGSIDSGPDSNFSSLPFNFSQDWAAAVVEDFTAHFELDFSMNTAPPNQFIEAEEGLIPGLQDGITFHTGVFVVGVGWTFNPTIHALVNTSAPVNFTYGFEFTIPANSAVFIPLMGDDNSNTTEVQTVGFNESKITPLNYSSNEPNEDFVFEVSFRPEFKIALEAVEIFDVLSGTIFADVPTLNVSVQQVHNVTHNCQPAPAGAHSNLVFSDLTNVVPTLGYDVGFVIDIVEQPIASHTFALGDPEPLPTSCLMYSSEAQSLVPVPAKSEGQRLATTGQVVALWVFIIASIHLM